MYRFLHTADLHLAADRPDRWEALDAVLDAAGEHGVDALVVSGDLLDRGEDHETLRPRVRERMDALDLSVWLIPGNHDRDAYRAGQDWGGSVRLLLSEPAAAADDGEVRFVGVPFPSEETTFRRLRRHVEELLDPSRANVLLLHGTLIERGDPRIQAESQEDEPGRYLPVHPGALTGLDLAYVALGHYHQHARREAGGCPVVYAGSPSPIGSHAWGPRTAALVEIGDGDAAVEPVRLPVGYRERLTRWLRPFREEEDLEELEEELAGRADDLCSLEVTLKGILVELEEDELRERVERTEERLGPSFDALDFALEGVGLDPARGDLFRTFRERLDERAEAARREGGPLEPEVRQRALELAARALTA